MKTVYRVKSQFNSSNGNFYTVGQLLSAFEYFSLDAGERNFVEIIQEPIKFEK